MLVMTTVDHVHSLRMRRREMDLARAKEVVGDGVNDGYLEPVVIASMFQAMTTMMTLIDLPSETTPIVADRPHIIRRQYLVRWLAI